MLHLFQFFNGSWMFRTQAYMAAPRNDFREDLVVMRLPLGPGDPGPVIPKNYQSVRVGDGMSCGEKIR